MPPCGVVSITPFSSFHLRLGAALAAELGQVFAVEQHDGIRGRAADRAGVHHRRFLVRLRGVRREEPGNQGRSGYACQGR